jgi:hypothetical protein
MSKTKVQKIPKVQMEHFQYLIVDLNITHKTKRKYYDWALYDNNILKLLYVCLNLTYFKKKLKLINMFHILKEQDHKLRIT